MHTRESTIAAGVDATRESFAAARWAANVARQRGGRLLLVHGYKLHGIYPAPVGEELSLLRTAGEQIVSEVAVALREGDGPVRLTTMVEPEPVVPLFERVAECVDALVLGHHRPGWLERLSGAGSVSSALSGRARCPVITVPFGNLAEHGPVVLALDVEAPSRQAIAHAFDQADHTDKSVVVIHVVPEAARPHELEQLYVRTKATIAPWESAYPGCDVRIQLVNGSPQHDLAAAIPQASLLLLTRPRAGATALAWRQSVTRAAQKLATCPIAVVDHV